MSRRVRSRLFRANTTSIRNISIVGNRDQNGVVSFDVRIRRRKK